MSNQNLSHAIYEAKHKNGAEYLTEKQQAAILDFVGKGCRANTKETIARRLRLPLLALSWRLPFACLIWCPWFAELQRSRPREANSWSQVRPASGIRYSRCSA